MIECSKLHLELLPGDGHHHLLKKDFRLYFKGVWHFVPKGFITDGASIPPYLRWICGDPNKSPRNIPALLHDYGYLIGGSESKRKEIDTLYRDLSIAFGIPKWKSNIEYLALRLCGRSHWKQK